MRQEDACLKCTICVSQCPVYREEPQFPGPKALGPEWFRKWQSGDRKTAAHVDDCTFCQLCEAACPVDVPIAHLIAQHKSVTQKPVHRRVRDWILSRPHWVARWPHLAQVPKPLGRWLHLAEHSRRPRVRGGPIARPSGQRESGRERVGLFVDCYSRGFDREVVDAARRLLDIWGYQVVLVPSKSQCCGAAAYAGGRPLDAQKIGRQMWRSLSRQLSPGMTLVTLNATCDAMVRDEWPRYFNVSLPLTVIPFAEFALAKAPDAFWQKFQNAVWEEPDNFIHTTCRAKVARGQGFQEDLAARAGYRFESLELACCGAAGSYAFKREHEDVARHMGEQAKEQIGDRAGTIMVDSGTCALHLEQITGLPARHQAYWLYQRYQALHRGS